MEKSGGSRGGGEKEVRRGELLHEFPESIRKVRELRERLYLGRQ